MKVDLNTSESAINILQIPEEIIENIISYLSYHEICEIRRVCRTFDKICKRCLCMGFSKVDKFHAQIQKHVKSQLPRRESERRNHSLARHVDILSAIETRLSLLSMTYMRYIDMDLCCFIPGKVLDELFSILGALKVMEQPPRSHEFLQELRDISSMAMEHFEEKIAPGLKAKMPAVTLPFPFSDPTNSPEPQPGPSNSVLPLSSSPMMRGPSIRQEVSRIQTQLRTQSSNIQQCRKENSELKNRFIEVRKKMVEQDKKSSAQGKLISEQNEVISELERKINDLSKKILEYDQKFAYVFSEMAKIKDEGEKSIEPPVEMEHQREDNSASTSMGKRQTRKRKYHSNASSTGRKKRRKAS
ncbi:hypothetical protein ACJMK2_035969 [Sinanodonta woodiana]|uniref:F-box domain-containing protein n=1 Tax=Sinanodonta woodiana TaxID=1069815 RepID=A0ABD3WJ44_SINWO